TEPGRCGRQDSNLRRAAFQATALPAELRPRAEWARLDSNQQPLVCETSALRTLSYSPLELRDKASNLDLHGQSVASSLIGRSRIACQTMLSMPLAYPSTLDRRDATSYVEELWSPALLRFPENCQAKAATYSTANCRARIAQRNLSLSGGASNAVFASQAGHHPSVLVGFAPDTTKATLS